MQKLFLVSVCNHVAVVLLCNHVIVILLCNHVTVTLYFRFLCDQRLLDDSFTHVNFHPMINTATLTLSVADFIRFLSVTSHDATPVNMSSSEQST